MQRARFSALTLTDVRRAINNLVAPNQLEAMAVDARQEIDLRIGASFTRFQSLLLQAFSEFLLQDSTHMLSKDHFFRHVAIVWMAFPSCSTGLLLNGMHQCCKSDECLLAAGQIGKDVAFLTGTQGGVTIHLSHLYHQAPAAAGSRRF